MTSSIVHRCLYFSVLLLLPADCARGNVHKCIREHITKLVFHMSDHANLALLVVRKHVSEKLFNFLS